MSFKLKFVIVFIIALLINFAGMFITKLSLLSIYPAAPKLLILAFSIGIFLTALYFIYFKNIVNEDHVFHHYLQEHKILIIIGTVMGSFMSGFSAINTSCGTVYFDNGTQKDATLMYTSREGESKTIVLPQGKATEIELPLGKIKFTLNGKTKEIATVNGPKQIFNIDTANAYILTQELYGDEGTTSSFKPKYEKIKKEYFTVHADYLFNAPSSIVSKRGDSKKKSILYRDYNEEKSE